MNFNTTDIYISYKELIKNVTTTDTHTFSVLVSFGMLLDETSSPMDFSRSAELSEQFEPRTSAANMEHMSARTAGDTEHKGLDLSNSVLDRLSQKVMR